MDIVLVTRDRPELTEQTVHSMTKNAADISRHRIVAVFDGAEEEAAEFCRTEAISRNLSWAANFLVTGKQLGVGGAKNFGAGWLLRKLDAVNRNRRTEDVEAVMAGRLLMFCDNDMYLLPGWDVRLEEAIETFPEVKQIGGWKHPYHGRNRSLIRAVGGGEFRIYEDGHADRPTIRLDDVDAVTGNCFVIRWSDWLRYGPFDANAIGPGQSEDYALSQKIKAAGGIVATLDPPVAIHCGLVNSSGEPAVGWREMEEMITGQLASLPQEVRDDVLILRPLVDNRPIGRAPGARDYLGTLKFAEDARRAFDYVEGSGSRQVPMTGAGRTQLVEPDGRVEMEIRADTQPTSVRDYLDTPASYVYRTYEGTRERLGMQPRGIGLGIDDKDARPLGINCGSGQRRFESTREVTWLNLDSQSVPPDRIPDVICNVGVDPLPCGYGRAQYVVIHQGLEHAGCGESAAMLRECWRALKRGGSLIITVPDMRALAGRWLGGEISTQIYMTNVYGAYMGDEADRHKWGWDWSALYRYLRDTLGLADMNCGDEHCTCEPPIERFDWREIPGADIAKDWWILGVEVIKP